MASLLIPAASRADEKPEAFFDKGRDYGVESLYSPLWGMVNRGFDTFQLRVDREPVVSILDTKNVLDNLADPLTPIRYSGDDGWGTFLKTEVLPLSYTQGTARWLPNYGLHLLGGGQTYAWMREWFIARDAPELAASIFAGAALMTGAIVNESIENKGVVGFNTDAIADIYIFDLGGIALFSFEGVRRFFGKTLELRDWSLQPATTYPRGHLHNVGNYYSLKVPVPFVPRLSVFAYGGVATLGGLSYRIDRELSISVAAGARIDKFDNSGGIARVLNVVTFKPSAAVFVDRNGSLLAALQVSDIIDYALSLNLYPNALVHTQPGLGAWMVMGQDGKWLTGLSFTHAFGVGFGVGTR